MLFVCKLGSRRQIDYQFGEAGTQVLANLNRLAGTQQTTLPVNQTVDIPSTKENRCVQQATVKDRVR